MNSVSLLLSGSEIQDTVARTIIDGDHSDTKLFFFFLCLGASFVGAATARITMSMLSFFLDILLLSYVIPNTVLPYTGVWSGLEKVYVLMIEETYYDLKVRNCLIFSLLHKRMYRCTSRRCIVAPREDVSLHLERMYGCIVTLLGTYTYVMKSIVQEGFIGNTIDDDNPLYCIHSMYCLLRPFLDLGIFGK